jgi:hypothetical protein
MTVPEAAEALAISRSKLYELITSGTSGHGVDAACGPLKDRLTPGI